MRKKILGIAVMAVVAVAAAWNINQSENEIKLSDLALDNVEALASGEGEADIAVTLGEDVLSNIPMGHPLTYRDVGTKI